MLLFNYNLKFDNIKLTNNMIKSMIVFLVSQIVTFSFIFTSIMCRPLILKANVYMMTTHPLLWFGLIYVAYINNIYQVIAHIQTGFKFLYKYYKKELKCEPYGSQDQQRSFVFIVSSIIDLLGWLWMFYLFNIWNIFYMYLAWTHFTVCLISFFDHKYFMGLL